MAKRKTKRAFDRARALRDLEGVMQTPIDRLLKPSGTWSDERSSHLTAFRKDVLNVYKRYMAEYEIGWVELVGALDLVRAEIIHYGLHNMMDNGATDDAAAESDDDATETE